MKKVNDVVMKVEMFFGVLLLFILFFVITVNMVSRYVFNKPIYWADELSGFVYVWATFLSCAFIMGRDGHIRIEVLERHFSPRVKHMFRMVENLATAAVFIYLIPVTLSIFPTLGKAMAMRFPLRYVYIILPLAFGLFVFHSLYNAYTEFKGLISPKHGIPASGDTKTGG